jgi:hypothetical protein
LVYQYCPWRLDDQPHLHQARADRQTNKNEGLS